MTVQEFYDALACAIPASLSMPWDHDGLQVCPDPKREVKKVLCTLDVTPAAVAFAIKSGCDVILSHHPLLFAPLSEIRPDSGKGATVMRLLASGIASMSFHTRYDALDGGMNDLLARAVGLTPGARFGDEGEKIGRLGTLATPLPLREYAAVVKYALSCPFVLLAPGGSETVTTVAVCGGEAKDFIRPAAAAHADLLICGRAGYHADLEAQEYGISVLETGHFNSEMICVPDLGERVETLGAEPVLFINAEIEAL